MSSLIKQYENSDNFMARVELNIKFGVNPQKWTLWIFDHIKFPKNARLLEIGCGNGLFWKSNLGRIPDDAKIILSDFSMGMIDEARKNLNDNSMFEFKVMDAQQIPYPDNSFDIVVANLMLYHIPDREKAISEISRVLKDDGTFYATTFGTNNMKELNKLVSNYDDNMFKTLNHLSKAFGLENGKKQLNDYFEDIKLIKYPDYLEVTEVEPLINYVLSFSNVKESLDENKINELKKDIKNIMKNKGKIKITKDMGMFIAKK